MHSFGENELSVSSWIVGRIRVQDAVAVAGLFPRLMFRLGIVLQENPKNVFEPNRPMQRFEVRDVHGEVRLEEHTNVVGDLKWIGPRHPIRSSTSVIFDSQVEMVCDLDWIRLERLEQNRAGRELNLWLTLWPAMFDAHGVLNCDIRPIRTAIPRDKWIGLLNSLANTRVALLEIAYPVLESPEFDAAIGHIKDARDQVNHGAYDEAVTACRRAIESLSAAINVNHQAAELEKAFAARTDDARGKVYAGIVSRLKELGNHAVHRREASGRYTRAEAQFVIGTAEHTLALMATLLRR